MLTCILLFLLLYSFLSNASREEMHPNFPNIAIVNYYYSCHLYEVLIKPSCLLHLQYEVGKPWKCVMNTLHFFCYNLIPSSFNRYKDISPTCIHACMSSVTSFLAAHLYVSKTDEEYCTYPNIKQAPGLVWAWYSSCRYGMQCHCGVSRTVVATAAHASSYSTMRAKGHGEDSYVYV